eukprot:comp22915_c0_seq1/m.36260 comp22915_c0_seq1/g.36260  ORF comp22915_c0_seq1/g.36260 comp22915_c0_seq1/m.36260 type:complete len:451 (-) comp22915_c0_seq1:491-1843(-)
MAVLWVLVLCLVAAVWWLRRKGRERHAYVVVLGDFGRSPRMQFHAASLARHGFHVHVIAYAGSKPHDHVASNQHITMHALREPKRLPPGTARALFLLYAPIKVVYQLVQLMAYLLLLPTPSHILVQNPPSIPTLACVWVASTVRGARGVVDWHNFGYTILAMNLGSKSPVVRIHEVFESFFGAMCHAHLCVTNAMKEWLGTNWAIRAVTLYDRAPSFFGRLDVSDSHKLYVKLSAENGGVFGPPDANIFTMVDASGTPKERADRPALVVSSTSWTDDEDFGVLLAALEGYEERKKAGATLPDIVCVITGKGPNRAKYEARIKARAMKHVTIHTMWVSAEDYPRLLGAADLGVSLHWSSSGLDLPMKVVDMFGCGLPVCAVNFNCLHELVQDGKNGLVFRDTPDLLQCLLTLLEDFHQGAAKLQKLREGVAEFQKVRWDESWDKNALPLFS